MAIISFTTCKSHYNTTHFILDSYRADDVQFLLSDNTDDNDMLRINTNEITKRCKFNNAHCMNSSPTNNDPIIQNNFIHQDCNISGENNQNGVGHNTNTPSYKTIIKLIEGSLLSPVVDDPQHTQKTGFQNFMTNSQSISHTLLQIQKDWGVTLDKKQVIAYNIICCTFLIDILRECSQKHLLKSIADVVGHTMNQTDERRIHNKLKARGGEDNLRMFLTGPAGAGKTTAIKAAQKYCHEFCQLSGILFSDSTFLFTAYVGSAASMCGGKTILKTAGLQMNGKCGALKQDILNQWRGVRILIIDEISFMNDEQLLSLNERLQQIRDDHSKPYGGMSIIFAGDFRQLLPGNATNKTVLFTTNNSRHFENTLNVALILENEHRFKDCPEYGKLLKEFWYDDLSLNAKKWINKRVVRGNKMKLPETMPKRSCYACPTNVERNSISAITFTKHLLNNTR